MISTTRERVLRTAAGSLLLLTALASETLAEAPSTSGTTPLAYIGPGAGLGAIGALLAVLGAIVLCVAGLVLYPLQLLRNRIRGRRVPSADGASTSAPSA